MSASKEKPRNTGTHKGIIVRNKTKTKRQSKGGINFVLLMIW
jgi:hypothetical protein